MPQKKKKRKKKSPSQEKNRDIQYKKQVITSLKHVLNQLECSELYDQISRVELVFFNKIRFGSIRCEPAPEQRIYSRQVKFYNWFFNRWMKEHQIELYKDGPKISLHDYFTVIYTFWLFGSLLKDLTTHGLNRVREGIECLLDNEDLEERAMKSLFDMVQIGSLYGGGIIGPFYSFDIDIQDFSKREERSCLKIIMHKKPAQQLSVKLGRAKRTVYRVGIPGYIEQFRWVTFKAKTLKIPWMDPDKTLDLYIQAHALNRLHERIDCLVGVHLRFEILVSLSVPRVRVGKGNNTRLIELRLDNQYKVGYLVVEVVEELVVIRTFLFLTQENTPEGEKLKEIMDASREDARYWALDRLSTFLASDISKNTRLKSKFIEAGCGSLFKLDVEFEGPAPETIRQADAMVKYFGLDEEEETTA